MKTKRIGLVLQGGGALGAYECGVVKGLYKHYPDFHLDVVSGVSIGAVNAAVLVGAKGDPSSTLEQMWRERFAVPDWPLVPQEMQPFFSMWGTPGMSQIRPDYLVAPLMATSLYDTSPLLRTLAEFIDLDRLNRNPTHLIVTAVDVETGQLTEFENHNPRKPFSFDMILASGSLPPNFPMTRATEQRMGKEGWFYDGGLSEGLPWSPVINRLEQCDDGDLQVERELIVVQLIPTRAQVPTNLLEVTNRFTQLLFASKQKLDQKFFHKIDSYIDLIQQIDKELPQDSKLRHHKAYRELMGYRKINKCIVITSTRHESLTGASNFSKASIEDRIECGYQDAFNALVENGIIE